MLKRGQRLWIFIFILPTALLFLLIYSVPLATIVITSFTDWEGIHPPTFAGLSNYVYLFSESDAFRAAISNTLLWMLIAATLHVLIGLAVGLTLAKEPPGWKAVRVIYFLPNIIPGVAMAMIFKLLLNPEIGSLNHLIRTLGFEDFYQNWFGTTGTAFIAVTLIWVFYAGLLTVLIVAEYRAIPVALFESAQLDGATTFQMDRYIAIPLLKRIIGVCVILSVAAMITEFAFVWLTTRGGPGYSTYNLALLLYKFTTQQNNYGLANTVGTLQVLLGIAVVGLVTWVTRERAH